MNGPADPLLMLAPDGVELGPGRHDVDRAEGVEIEARGGRAAVRDEVALEEPGAGVIPVGEGADGDLMLEPGAGAGRPPAAGRPSRADRGEQPLERGRAHPAERCGGVGRQPQCFEGEQPVQEFGEERLEPDGPDLPAGLPEDLGGDGDVRAIDPRPAGPRRARGRARWPVQSAEGGLAVISGHRHDLIQDATLLPARRRQVPRSLGGHVLVHARPRHGHLPIGIGSGNRHF